MNTPDAPATLNLTKRQRWSALAVLCASLFVIAMDMTILNIALPEIAGELRPTAGQQLWIIDIYSLVLAGLLVPMAAIADRWGRKRMLLFGYVIFGAASVLVLFADSAAAVIAIRALLGIGGAMIMPTTLSMIRVIFSDARERATALAVWAAISGLGTALGPLVGGALLESFSWHAAFLVNVPLMLIGIIAGIFLLPESKVANPPRLDYLAAVLAVIGMVSLVWSIKQFGKEASFVVPIAWAGLALAAVTLIWFARRCLYGDAPLLDLGLFRSRPFSAGIIAALGSTFSLVAAILLIAQWLQLIHGSSPIEAGYQLIPVAVAGMVASLAAPPLSRLIGARAVLGGGLVLAAVGMAIIGLAGQSLTLSTMIFALLFVGAGTGSLAIGSAMIMANTPDDKAGNAGALEETSYELGATLGVAILGTISALIFRGHLVETPGITEIPAELLDPAKESLGASMAIAGEFNIPLLADAASTSFVHSLEVTSFIGAAIMAAVGVLVFVMTPKGTSAAGGSH